MYFYLYLYYFCHCMVILSFYGSLKSAEILVMVRAFNFDSVLCLPQTENVTYSTQHPRGARWYPSSAQRMFVNVLKVGPEISIYWQCKCAESGPWNQYLLTVWMCWKQALKSVFIDSVNVLKAGPEISTYWQCECAESRPWNP